MALIWVSKECSGENAKDQALKEQNNKIATTCSVKELKVNGISKQYN